MFGTNKIAKRVLHSGASLAIIEIFDTIQGEGPFAGRPAVFIRLAGCHLKCTFCDTDFESNVQMMSYVEIVEQAVVYATSAGLRQKRNATTLFVITGGEPFRQNIAPLCTCLLQNPANMVQIETAGNLWQPDMVEVFDNPANRNRLHIVCSPKTPSVHDDIRARCFHWKYIIKENGYNKANGIPNFNTQSTDIGQERFREVFSPNLDRLEDDTIWLQPCEAYKVQYKALPAKGAGQLADQKVTAFARDEEQSKRNLDAAVNLVRQFNYRLTLQMHKIVNLP